MTLGTFPAAILDMPLQPTELAVYIDLVHLAGGAGRGCQIGIRRLAERRSIAPGTVISVAQRLRDYGLLETSAQTTEFGGAAPTIWKPLEPKPLPDGRPSPAALHVDQLELDSRRELVRSTLWRSDRFTDNEREVIEEKLNACRDVADVVEIEKQIVS